MSHYEAKGRCQELIDACADIGSVVATSIADRVAQTQRWLDMTKYVPASWAAELARLRMEVGRMLPI